MMKRIRGCSVWTMVAKEGGKKERKKKEERKDDFDPAPFILFSSVKGRTRLLIA